MWSAPRFRSEDRQDALRAIGDIGFALLVSGDHATHCPVLVRDEDPLVLEGHFARANPHRHALSGAGLLAFLGPHDYVTPRWYEPAAGFVPTWNYVAVHARGELTAIEDPADSFAILERTVSHFEGRRDDPWPLAAAMDRARDIAPGTVAFTMAVSDLSWQFKLSQDKQPDVRDRVIGGFADTNPALADEMRRAR